MTAGLSQSSRCGHAGREGASEAGTTLLESLTVLVIASMLLAVSVPSLMVAYRKQQLTASAASVRGMIRHAHLKAVKEKTDHRIVFHDEDAITPNRVVIEEWQSGAFVALDAPVYQLPNGVKILGSPPMDSTDTMEVTRRGHCDAGSVYLEDLEGNGKVVEVKTSCFATVQ